MVVDVDPDHGHDVGEPSDMQAVGELVGQGIIVLAAPSSAAVAARNRGKAQAAAGSAVSAAEASAAAGGRMSKAQFVAAGLAAFSAAEALAAAGAVPPGASSAEGASRPQRPHMHRHAGHSDR